MSDESRRVIGSQQEEEEEHTLTEQIEIAASELVDRTKELIEEGNVRRLIIRNPDDKVLLEVPLTTGVAVGGVVTLRRWISKRNSRICTTRRPRRSRWRMFHR
jgi:hypothetical protein